MPQRNNAPLNAQIELMEIRQIRRTARRKPYRVSRLNRYRAELVALRQAGASYPDLVTWLRIKKRKVVAHTTVMRFLKNLPEMQTATEVD